MNIKKVFLITILAIGGLLILYGYYILQNNFPENPPILKSYDTTGEVWILYLKANKTNYLDIFFGVLDKLLFDGEELYSTSSIYPPDGTYSASISSIQGETVVIFLRVNPPGSITSGIHKIEFTTRAGDFITLYLEANTKKSMT